MKVNYNVLSLFLNPYFFGILKLIILRESSLVLKRNVLIALGIVLAARFGHLKHVNKCH